MSNIGIHNVHKTGMLVRELQVHYQEWSPEHLEKVGGRVTHCLASSQASWTVKPCRFVSNLCFPLDMHDGRYYEMYKGLLVLFIYTIIFYLDIFFSL